MSYRMFIIVATLLLILPAACSSPEADPPPPPTATAATVEDTPAQPSPEATEFPVDDVAEAEETAAETAVLPTAPPLTFATPQPVDYMALNEDEPDAEEIPVAPASLYDFLVTSELAEETEPGELLLLAMQAILGEAELPPIEGDPEGPLYMGMSFLNAIQTFIASADSDPDLRDEVARYYDILFPSLERIEAYTAPTNQSQQNRGVGLAAVANQEGVVACDEAWRDGLPLPTPGVTECFFADRAHAGDQTYAVYYPAEWGTDTDKHLLFEAALEAMVDSHGLYTEYGLMGDAVVIFSPAYSLREGGRGTMAVNWHVNMEEEPCPIYVYGRSHELPLEQFKQAIAHEMFHCYQAWNYSAVVQNHHTNVWWFEGTAEYFSNLVYPAADLEHRLVPNFDAESVHNSIFEMKHANAIFFQHLANEIGGPQPILDLIDSFDLTSLSQQEQVMRDFPDMLDILHRLILAHMTVGIPDPGGTPLYSYHLGGQIFAPMIEDEGSYLVSAEPFVLKRYRVDYGPEKEYEQEGLLPGNGRYNAALREQRRLPRAWGSLPELVPVNCNEPTKYIVAITTLDNSTPHLEVQVERAEEDEACDCLRGTWRVIPESFAALMNHIMQQQGAAEGMPAGMSFEIEIAGDNLIQFREDGQVVTQRDGFQIRITVPDAPAAVTTIYGSGSGRYTDDGQLLTIIDLVDVAEEVTVTVGGQMISAEMGPDSGTVTLFGHSAESPGFGGPDAPVSESVTYACEQQLLTWYMPYDFALEFERVDRVLPLPEREP